MVSGNLIAVSDATGIEGGGLAHAILSDPDSSLAVRALTKDPDSPAARALAAAGAEVVRADYDDYDAMVRALGGVHGAYLTTDRRALRQVRDLARAVDEARVRHVVWSARENTDGTWTPAPDGRYYVPDSLRLTEVKALITTPRVPTTLLRTAMPCERLLTVGLSRREADGRLVLSLPIGQEWYGVVAGGDIGKVAQMVFESAEAFFGHSVRIAGDRVRGQEIAAGLGIVYGEPVEYQPAAAVPGRGDVLFGYTSEDFRESAVEGIRLLCPGLQSFDEWARRRAGRADRPPPRQLWADL